jgi:WD40 repeat protein
MYCFCDRPQKSVPRASVLILISVFSIPGITSAQVSAATNVRPASLPQPTGGSAVSRAYVDYLQAFALANEGSKPEALHLLAESLRLQPVRNPASALAFELLIEKRADTPLTLLGHRGTITAVSYSLDGTKILTASADRTARIWDARTGAQLTPPLEHDAAVDSAAFSPDGKQVVTGSAESKVRIWDAASGKPASAPLNLNGAVVCVSFSPDGKMIAAGTDDGKLRTWNAVTGEPVSPVVIYHEEVYGITFSQDGAQLLTATGDRKAEFLDARTGQRLRRMPHGNIVFTARFSPDEKLIVTASGDSTARIWDAQTGAPTGVVLQHGFRVQSAAFNKDASRVVTASSDHTARVWDVSNGLPITPPLQHPAPVGRVSFSPDGSLVATVAGDGAVRLWDSTSGEKVHLPVSCDDKEPFAVFSPNGHSLLVAAGTSIRILDLPPAEAAPPWLIELADFASTQANYNLTRVPNVANAEALRLRLLNDKDNDSWTHFGKWYFADSGQRAISPWSDLSLESYVKMLIARGDRKSLEYANSLAHEFPSWGAKIRPLLAKLPPDPSKPMEQN